MYINYFEDLKWHEDHKNHAEADNRLAAAKKLHMDSDAHDNQEVRSMAAIFSSSDFYNTQYKHMLI